MDYKRTKEIFCMCPVGYGGEHCEYSQREREYLNIHNNSGSAHMLQKLPTRSFSEDVEFLLRDSIHAI